MPSSSRAYDRITDDQLKEHLGRRGWMQCQSKEKGPRYSPGELNPGENVRVQDDKTKYWSKQAKVVKKLSARTYLLKSESRMFKRNIRFIKAAPNGDIRFIKAAPNGDKTKYWSKQAKVVKKLRARTYLLKSGSKMFKRNIRFIKAAPNGQDMDPPNITQAIKGENDCRPKVQGSNPTDGPMTRSRMKKDRRQTAQSQRHH